MTTTVRAPRTAAAQAARRRKVEASLQRIHEALTRLRREKVQVSVAAVARRANVSRTFLYEEAIQRITTENTTLKQRVRQLSTDNRTFDERLKAARSNLRFQDRRVADLEARLTECVNATSPTNTP